MRSHLSLLIALASILVAASGLRGQSPFSHAAHEGLFPLCTGCHTLGDDGTVSYPSEDSCTSCHDGDQEPRVDWTTPAPFARLDHRFHETGAAEAPRCDACHGAGDRSAVTVIRGGCTECHGAHHGGEVRCRACHAESPQPEHTVEAHAGCGGAGCHDVGAVAGIRFERELCLTCHRPMLDHKPDQRCGRCHAVSQPGG